ncbi:MAG: hypothetical protein R3A47_06485 [Polyangiales bacterium]
MDKITCIFGVGLVIALVGCGDNRAYQDLSPDDGSAGTGGTAGTSGTGGSTHTEPIIGDGACTTSQEEIDIVINDRRIEHAKGQRMRNIVRRILQRFQIAPNRASPIA